VSPRLARPRAAALAVLLAAAALVQPLPAAAQGAVAPAHVARELARPRLAGAGGYSWFGLPIYTARLWVGEQGYRADAPEAAPFVLELRYARALAGARIAEASVEQMERLGAGSAPQRARWLLEMKAIFPDVQAGSQLSGVFLPAAGTRFYLDGRALATLAEPAFAKAFYAIWLDPASSARGLRESLLRDAAPAP
jgi:hypothetical protein